MLVYILACEPSGDILASRLMQSLRAAQPDFCFAGVGGETMAALGFKSLFNIAETSVMGFMEVLPRLPLIMQRMGQVVADIERQQPRVIVTVDSWGFVSSLLKRLKKRGCRIPVVHYVAPQVWAWKKGRARTAAKLVDRLMTLWPYEAQYFEKYGLRCDCVGHPVLENTANITDDLAAFRQQHHIPQGATLLCVLPGSRRHELKKLAPIFKKVVAQLHENFPSLFVVAPTVTAIADELRRTFADMSAPHCIIEGQRERYKAFRTADFAVAASGTVTLELAACGTPHLIAYTFSPLTNFIAQRWATTRYANLINIAAQEFVIPEFTLRRCRADLIAQQALDLLRHPELAQAQVQHAQQILNHLNPNGSLPSERAAQVVMEVMK
jgi:lipid-A-disaccharide synthase